MTALFYFFFKLYVFVFFVDFFLFSFILEHFLHLSVRRAITSNVIDDRRSYHHNSSTATEQHFVFCCLTMACHQILQVLSVGGAFWWVLMLEPDWLTETAELSDRLSEGIHRETMCPLRGSEVSLLTTTPLLKFVFSGGAALSCVPLIIRACAPHCPKQGRLCYTIVCVYFTKNLFIFCVDPVLPELERVQLGIWLRLSRADRGPSVFCLASKNGWRFYLDNFCHFLQFYSFLSQAY